MAGAYMVRRAVGIVAATVAALAAAADANPSAAGEPVIGFAPVVGYPTGSTGIGPGPGATTTVAGDVDGDGDIDVIITDVGGAGPIVLSNDGAAAFAVLDVIEGAQDAGALAAGDINGDAVLDLVGRTGSGVIPILGDGDGTFTSSAEIAVAQNAQASIAIGDVDGDGLSDVIVTTPAGVRSLLGNGDGTFTLGPETALLGLLADLEVANLDADATPDLLVVDATPAAARAVALTGSGDGSFAVSDSAPVGHGPEGVLAADLDGDGDDDAVSVDSFSFLGDAGQASITVLHSDGSGGLDAVSHPAVVQGPVSGATGDLDRDGDVDAAVAGVAADALTVYAGDGDGALDVAVEPPVTGLPQTPVIADLDGDDWPDIAVPGPGELSVLRNTSGDPAPPPTPAPEPTAPGGANDDGALAATGSTSPLPAAGVLLSLGLLAAATVRRQRAGPIPSPTLPEGRRCHP